MAYKARVALECWCCGRWKWASNKRRPICACGTPWAEAYRTQYQVPETKQQPQRQVSAEKWGAQWSQDWPVWPGEWQGDWADSESGPGAARQSRDTKLVKILHKAFASLPEEVKVTLTGAGYRPKPDDENEDPLWQVLNKHRKNLPAEVQEVWDQQEAKPPLTEAEKQQEATKAVGKAANRLKALVSKRVELQAKADETKEYLRLVLENLQDLDGKIKQAKDDAAKAQQDLDDTGHTQEDPSQATAMEIDQVEEVCSQIGVILNAAQKEKLKELREQVAADGENKRQKQEAGAGAAVQVPAPPGLKKPEGPPPAANRSRSPPPKKAE